MADPIWTSSDLAVTASDDAATPNTATLTLYQCDGQVSGLVPDGRTAIVQESCGAIVGVRKGARAYPTISFSGFAAGDIDAFAELVNGLTTGFTSVIADISPDYPGVDLDLKWTSGSDDHEIAASDCILTEMSEADGDSLTRSYTFQVLGPLTMDGKTLVSSR